MGGGRPGGKEVVQEGIEERWRKEEVRGGGRKKYKGWRKEGVRGDEGGMP